MKSICPCSQVIQLDVLVYTCVAGLHSGNITTVVIDLYDTNTITMVACESCLMTVHFKKFAERCIKGM